MHASVSIVNHSTVCAQEQVAGYLPALQRQVSEHFAPVWSVDATLTLVAQGALSDPDAWVIAVLDNSDQAGALGYHDTTASGLPLGKVFAGSDLAYHQQVSVTLSHEVLELLADPEINLCVEAPQQNPGFDQYAVEFYALEVCDPVEADEYAYDIDGIQVSDFVYPSWFGGVPAARFDHCNHLSNALQVLPQGYIGVWTPATGWTQRNGQGVQPLGYASRPQVGSRRERRRSGRPSWMQSATGG